MPRRRPDDVSEPTDIRNVRTNTADNTNAVRSIGYSDTVSTDGRTVLRQPVNIHTHPPPVPQQETDATPGGDEHSFPDIGARDEGTIVQITAPAKKAPCNNFFVSTVRLLV